MNTTVIEYLNSSRYGLWLTRSGLKSVSWKQYFTVKAIYFLLLFKWNKVRYYLCCKFMYSYNHHRKHIVHSENKITSVFLNFIKYKKCKIKTAYDFYSVVTKSHLALKELYILNNNKKKSYWILAPIMTSLPTVAKRREGEIASKRSGTIYYAIFSFYYL